MFGAKLAGAYGSFHAQAAYMSAQINGQGYESADLLQGCSTQAGWFITANTRPYDEKKGVWNRVIHRSNVLSGDGWGAWEVAARYNLMDQNTKNIFGGSIDTGTLGLNWYLTPRVRLMTNWVHVFATYNGPAAKAGASCSQIPPKALMPILVTSMV
jgi:phosphate-selective porin OprO/OprP